GIENYSRYFDRREAGHPPFCLLNYFPSDFITIVDESHVTLPQITGMSGGDRARKNNLVEYGFRLEAAKDNRPLTFNEYSATVGTSIYVSATPGDYEREVSCNVVIEQLIRPTGLIDPPMILRPTEYQIDNLIYELNKRVESKDKVMITTITKKMAEEVSKYLDRMGVRNRYIHSDIDTIERVQILEDLRANLFDVLVGVNLLREGLDLPEVALVAILDADKEGFLRNKRSLTQIAGRAARHATGEAILYGNNCSDSLASAIITSNRQRTTQIRYNLAHNQIPSQAQKSGGGANQLLASRPTEESMTMNNYPIVEEHYQKVAEPIATYSAAPDVKEESGSKYRKGIVDYTTGEVIFTDEVGRDTASQMGLDAMIEDEKSKMEAAAKLLDFKTAMVHRDKMNELIRVRDSKRSKGAKYTI
ncbi:MAG: helicase-related protein, partial [Rikenellaceae bacterium]